MNITNKIYGIIRAIVTAMFALTICTNKVNKKSCKGNNAFTLF